MNSWNDNKLPSSSRQLIRVSEPSIKLAIGSSGQVGGSGGRQSGCEDPPSLRPSGVIPLELRELP